MLNLKKDVTSAVFYLFLAAVLGTTLRLFVVVDLPAEYRFLVHTHSHVALLGWVYVALTTLLYKLYLQPAGVTKRYRRIFWLAQVSIVGMLFTFPFQGYALFSIFFSTLFLVASYFFAALFFKKSAPEMRNRFSFKLAKWAVIYMIISSIGPWALGGIMNTLGSTSVWYKLAIYFYLHFQYNGWFILGLLAVLFYFLEVHNFALEVGRHKIWLRIINTSIVLTFFLSTLFMEPHWFLNVLGGMGVLLQSWILLLFFFWLYPKWKKFSGKLKSGVSGMLVFAGVLWAIKNDMQLLSALPYFAKVAFTNLDFVIGYLHLVFLGVVSIALFALLKQADLLKFPKWGYRGFLCAFLLTEVLIFYKGTAAWLEFSIIFYYYELLAAGSILFPLSLIGIIWYSLKSK
ncbi:MAG TPA: hypothetical protein VFD80_05880 [Flavobacteriaceae bacterium]|nr:hypothetical protein [Flavobacteriaceae bacterium]